MISIALGLILCLLPWCARSAPQPINDDCVDICDLEVKKFLNDTILYTYTQQTVDTILMNPLFESHLTGTLKTRLLNDVITSEVVDVVKSEIIGGMRTNAILDQVVVENVTTIVVEAATRHFTGKIKAVIWSFLLLEIFVVLSILLAQVMICVVVCSILK